MNFKLIQKWKKAGLVAYLALIFRVEEDVSTEKSGGDADLSDVSDTSKYWKVLKGIERYVQEFFVFVIF